MFQEECYKYDDLKTSLRLANKTMEELWKSGNFGRDRYIFVGFMLGATEAIELMATGGFSDVVPEPIESELLDLAAEQPLVLWDAWNDRSVESNLDNRIISTIAAYGETYRDMIAEGAQNPNELVTG